jgi:molybdenum cofactor biosynthesis enzyme MoaA
MGFITPMIHNFCEGCNRVRLTCTGTLYMCLGQNDAGDLREVLRASDDPAYRPPPSTRQSPASRKAMISSSIATTARPCRAI